MAREDDVCSHCGSHYTERYSGQDAPGVVTFHCFACGCDFDSTTAGAAADILRRWFLSNEAIDSDQLQASVRTAIKALADNERLLALIEQVATQVATEDTLAYEGDAGADQRCVLCGGVKGKDGIFEYQHVSDYHEWKHADNCPVTQARALLDQK